MVIIDGSIIIITAIININIVIYARYHIKEYVPLLRMDIYCQVTKL